MKEIQQPARRVPIDLQRWIMLNYLQRSGENQAGSYSIAEIRTGYLQSMMPLASD
jgi:hypothetical protein